MSTIMEYKAVSAGTVEDLTTAVNAAIADGFQPLSAQISCFCCMNVDEMMSIFAQSLVKYS